MSRKRNIFNALPIVAAHYGHKFGVKVVLGNNESDATTNSETITVPNVPESYPNKDVVWGYLIHEAAHIRHTDFPVWYEVAMNDSGLRKVLLNILEDARIEQAMMVRFPGVRSDIDAMAFYLKDKGFYKSVSGEDEPGRVLQLKVLYWLCANMLQQPLEDLANAADIAMQKVFPEGVNTRLAVLLRKATKTESTSDCLSIVDKILQMLEEEAEKEEEKSEGGDSPPDDDQNDFSDIPDDKGGKNSPGGDSDDDHYQPSSGSYENGQSAETGSSAAKENIVKALKSNSDDFDDDAIEALKSELFQEARINGDDSYCTVPVAPPTVGDEVLGRQLLGEVQGTTSKLRSQLMGLVQAARQTRDRARRKGRKLDTKRVTRILSGDTRIFRHREHRAQANTAVHLLTDLSGSMRGEKEVIAKEASLAIALALESIPGVSPAVTYFCGSSDHPVRSAVSHGELVKRQVHRFVEPISGRTPMAEGIWYAAYELFKTGENRKLMIVITDGDPDNDKACHTVIDLCDNAGIETVGIGICHKGVEDYFERSIVIDSAEELRTTLFQLMRDKLTIEAA